MTWIIVLLALAVLTSAALGSWLFVPFAVAGIAVWTVLAWRSIPEEWL